MKATSDKNHTAGGKKQAAHSIDSLVSKLKYEKSEFGKGKTEADEEAEKHTAQMSEAEIAAMTIDGRKAASEWLSIVGFAGLNELSELFKSSVKKDAHYYQRKNVACIMNNRLYEFIRNKHNEHLYEKKPAILTRSISEGWEVNSVWRDAFFETLEEVHNQVQNSK